MNRHSLLCLLILLLAVGCNKNDPSSPPSNPVPSNPPPTVVHVTSVTVTGLSSVLLLLDSTFQLAASVAPANATNTKLIYSSSDSSLLKVDTLGRVTDIALGMSAVTIASADNPTLFVKIQVAVVKNYTVYASGYGPAYYEPQAIVWTNSTYATLTPGYVGGGYTAKSMTLMPGGDLYVAGTTLNSDLWEVATYWKNGVATQLSNPSNDFQSYATGIAATGSRVYVTGYVVRSVNNPSWDPTYTNEPVWNASYYTIDGSTVSRTLLTADTNNIQTVAYSLALSGGDVYVAGAWEAGKQNRLATYWKNDSSGAVALAPGGDWSEAMAIAVQNGNVYIAGYEQCPNYGCIPTVKLWKNDMHSVVNLTNGTITAYPSCLATNDTVQFVGGYVINAAGKKQAVLWRVQGSTVSQLALSDGTADAVVNGITVSGNDIFLAGYQVDTVWNVRAATYWRVYGSIVSPVVLPAGRSNGALANSEANAIRVF